MFERYYADLHIHLGASSSGRPVKITASRAMTFEAVAAEAVFKKGINIAGIIDCASPSVIKDIEKMLSSGELYELPDGGFLHKEKLLILLGSEIESLEPTGGVSHHLSFFPFFSQIKEFSRRLRPYITNIELSSQSAGISASQLFEITESCGGVFVPAHVFTPHKSLYGKVASRLSEVFTQTQQDSLAAVELGLSADTFLADRISELHTLPFLSSSDAHSLPKIAREYTVFEMQSLSFKELMLALKGESGRRIVANFGMDPRLGRYNRSYCRKCDKLFEIDPPVLSCPECGLSDKDFVVGVADRIAKIADLPENSSPQSRPPYFYQVPLEFVRGVSSKVRELLISVFGTEMEVLHNTTYDMLAAVVKPSVASDILAAREGKLLLSSGGGGKYGSVSLKHRSGEQLRLNFD